MTSKVRVVIREARPEDRGAREELVRHGFTTQHFDAFLYYYFQELTLQGVVLGGAVLFIFMGASVAACASLVPLAAGIVALSVYIAHSIAADSQIQKIRNETVGWVAEARGPLGALPDGPLAITNAAHDDVPTHRQIVGTLSVSECWDTNGTWMHGLAVKAPWRRRGVARALICAARQWAATEGLPSVEAALSTVGEGRAVLHACGWALRHSYHRPLLGAALTLPMVRMGVDLPHA